MTPDGRRVVVGGMGGSGLPARVLARFFPGRITLHQSYGLPEYAPEDALYIAISYSGNTAETLDFFEHALGEGRRTAVIASGGTLLQEAKMRDVPYVEVPLQLPARDQLVLLTKALLALMGEKEMIARMNALTPVEDEVRDEGKRLAEAFKDRIPLFYASVQNEALAYIAKITLNETAKVPAFSNVFPEMNHNDMQGLDPLGATAALSAPLLPVLLLDPADDERVQARMGLFRELIESRGMTTVSLVLPDDDPLHALVFGWLAFRAASHALADYYGVPASETPFIEEFKRRL